MAKFRITAPDGQVYDITAPDDATPDQVMTYAKGQFSAKREEKPVNRTTVENIGLGTRNAIEGLVNAGSILTDPMGAALNAALGTNIRSYRESVPEALTALGLPKPETPQERMTARVSRELVGILPSMGAGMAARGMGGATEAVGRALAEKPIVQAAAAAGSGMAGQAVEEGGGGPGESAMASLGGALLGTIGAEGVGALGRSLAGLVQPFTQGGRERMAADALLRASAKPDDLAERLSEGLADTSRRLPGSPVTTAQAARDPGLMVLESGLRSDAQRVGGQGGMSGAAALRDVEAQRNAARLGFLQSQADDLSPELRGLGARKAIGENLAGQRAAVGRAYNEAMESGATVPIDDLKVAAGEVAAKYFGPGSGGAPGPLKSVLEEIGQAQGPQGMEWVQNVRSRLGEMAGQAARSGEQRLSSAAGAIKQSLDGLTDNILSGPATMRREMGQTFGRNEEGAKVVGDILRRDAFGSPMMTADSVIQQAVSSPRNVQQVLKASGGKADEVKGLLRGQFIENMLTASKTTGGMVDAAGNVSDALSPAQFKRFFDKNAPVAKEIFDQPGQYMALQRLANDFSETQLSALTAKARGSDTAQNLSVGNLIARASNGIIDPATPLAQTLTGLGPVLRLIYAAPEAATRELLVQAAVDPKFAKILLDKAGPQSIQRASEYLNSTMGQRLRDSIGATAARIQQQQTIAAQNHREMQDGRQ